MTASTETRCATCDRELEVCACCERGDCPDPICQRDLLYLTGESIPAPHTHGG